MPRVTKERLDTAVANLRRQAVKAGLMAEEDSLIYERGVNAGGVPAAIYAGRRGSHVGFVPRFTTDQSQADHVQIIEAVSYALMAVNAHKEATK